MSRKEKEKKKFGCRTLRGDVTEGRGYVSTSYYSCGWSILLRLRQSVAVSWYATAKHCCLLLRLWLSVVDDQFANGELMLEVNGHVCGENNTEWLRLDHRVAESSKFWLDGAVIRQGLYQGVVWIVSEDNWCDFSSTNGVSAKSENSVWISSD